MTRILTNSTVQGRQGQTTSSQKTVLLMTMPKKAEKAEPAEPKKAEKKTNKAKQPNPQNGEK